jgi:hypothetical protein
MSTQIKYSGAPSLAQEQKTQIDHAKLELLRDFAFEVAGRIRMYSELAQIFLECGDDHGLVYASRGAVVHFRTLAKTIDDIADISRPGLGGA